MSVMNEVGWLLVVVVSLAGCGGPIPEPKQADEDLPGVEPEPEPDAPIAAEGPDEEPDPSEEPPAEPAEPPPAATPEPPPKPACAELPKGTCEVTAGCAWNTITKCVDE
jgi:hypothetical protein